MTVIGWSNDLQKRALEKKAQRLAKQRQLAYDRKQAPAYKRNMPRLWAMAKRAATKGMCFDLTIEWLDKKLALKHCEATGLPFKGAATDTFGLTIDRKDSTKGYTQENCWAVCWIYNRAKLDGTHEDLVTMARALVEKDSAGYDRRQQAQNENVRSMQESRQEIASA